MILEDGAITLTQFCIITCHIDATEQSTLSKLLGKFACFSTAVNNYLLVSICDLSDREEKQGVGESIALTCIEIATLLSSLNARIHSAPAAFSFCPSVPFFASSISGAVLPCGSVTSGHHWNFGTPLELWG